MHGPALRIVTFLVCVSVPARLATAAEELFRETFDTELEGRWDRIAPEVSIVADPGDPANRVLRVAGTGWAYCTALAPVRDFVLEARVMLAEPGEWSEAPVLVRVSGDRRRMYQVYLEGKSSQVLIVRGGEGGFVGAVGRPTPKPVRLGEWHTLKVICAGDNTFGYLDGTLIVHRVDDWTEAGTIGVRVGGGATLYDDITVSILSADEVAQMQCPLPPDCVPNCPGMLRNEVSRECATEFGTLLLHTKAFLLPAARPELRVSSPDFSGGLTGVLRVEEGPELSRATARLVPGAPAVLSFDPAPLQERLVYELTALPEGGEAIKVAAIPTRAVLRTDIHSDSLPRSFIERLKETVRRDRRVFEIDGAKVAMNPTWLRDHVHELKAWKYWEGDVRSGLDHFLQRQQPPGFFYEIISSITDGHADMVDPEWRELHEANGLAYIRLELEADIEYLMVEGVYQAWQATGDDEWMQAQLPRLRRALTYCMTDPDRWEPAYGLMKRPFTIDTWDFTYGQPADNRRIEPDTPMAIMHGDNTGLFWACNLLAAMLEHSGEDAQADEWRRKAADIRQALNEHCWQGHYYTHLIHLDDTEFGGPSEEGRLSLSNAYALNRGVLTVQQAQSVIAQYRARRLATERTHFAEWFSIDPPYPDWLPPGTYINGGIAGFVAGELAKGAFVYGEETYGADILARVRSMVERDGDLYFLYTSDGQDQGGGPRGWSAAAVFSAIAEGMAGVVDEGTRFSRILLAPRWPACGDRQAAATLVYPASGAFFSYEFDHNVERQQITLRWRASHTGHVTYHVLLPRKAQEAEAVVDDSPARCGLGNVATSVYCDFEQAVAAPGPERAHEVVVRYQQPRRA